MIETLAVVIPAFNEEKYIGSTLDSLYTCNRPNAEINFIVVDNGSSDRTSDAVDQFSKDHPDFPLSLIAEGTKGTGVACNTGFRFGIDQLGAEVIVRTDSDTLVTPDWLRSIEMTFNTSPNAKLTTGPVHPAKDEWYESIDYLAFPLSRGISEAIIGVSQHTLHGRRLLTPGHNMATKASAYDAVGGFPLTSIDDISEDMVFRKKIVKEFGVKSVVFSNEMIVFTSMRRIRQTGYSRLASYYLNRGNKNKRLKASQGVIDIR